MMASYFSYHCNKIPIWNNLREERFLLTSNFRALSSLPWEDVVLGGTKMLQLMTTTPPSLISMWNWKLRQMKRRHGLQISNYVPSKIHFLHLGLIHVDGTVFQKSITIWRQSKPMRGYNFKIIALCLRLRVQYKSSIGKNFASQCSRMCLVSYKNTLKYYGIEDHIQL